MDKKFKVTGEQRKSPKELRKEKVEFEMYHTIIATLTGKAVLWDYIQKIGVRNRIQYHNIVEVIAPKKIRTMNLQTIPKDKTHDYGLIFNDGFEIRGVSSKVFKYCDGEVIKKREGV